MISSLLPLLLVATPNLPHAQVGSGAGTTQLVLARANSDVQAPSPKSEGGPNNESVAIKPKQSPLSKSRREALDEALHHLATAQTFANEQPALGAGYLERALERLAEHGELIAGDPRAREQRLIALLVLARAQLLLEQKGKAEQTIDESIRCAGSGALPIDLFGPSLVKLHDERLARMQATGRAELQIRCHRACRVYVNESHVAELKNDESAAKVELWPGEYRVLVVDHLGVSQPLRTRFVGEGKSAAAKLIEYKNDDPKPPEPEAIHISDQKEIARLKQALKDFKKISGPRYPKRWMQPWINAVAMSIGGMAIGVGGTLVWVDGLCNDTTTLNRCNEFFETKTAGAVVIVSGSAIVLTASALLVADAVRRKKARKAYEKKLQARLQWSGLGLRF